MPQIGWFELLLIIIIAVIVIGPKDFPVVLKKGRFVGRNYKKIFLRCAKKCKRNY